MKNVLIASLAILALTSCDKDDTKDPGIGPNHPSDAQSLRLKDVTVRNLPSPYYQFVYNDSGYITNVNFAGGEATYVTKHNDRIISEIRNEHPINKDRLQYVYENKKVSIVKVLNEAGEVYKRAFLTYGVSDRLHKIEWEIKQQDVGFASYITLNFSYHADGNLMQMIRHYHAIPGRQNEMIRSDLFDNYDNKINSDGFSLLHLSNEHLLLLPRVKLQLNNPGRNIRTGDGINYKIEYRYTYDAQGRPLSKTGDFLFTNGPDAGQRFETLASFTYY